METLSLKRDSWHYKIAKIFGWREYRDSYNYTANDFCSYVRRVILGLLIMSAAGFLGSALAIAFFAGMGEFIYWLLMCLMTWSIYPASELAVIGTVVFVIGTPITLVIGLVNGWIRFSDIKIKLPSCDKIPLCEDTKRFIVAAYTVFHDKVCFKLEFRNDDN